MKIQWKRQRRQAPNPRPIGELLESRRLLSAAYSVTDIGEFPTSVDNGSHDAVPTGVNDQGTVVGYTTRNFGGQFAAFVWNSGVEMIKLDSVNTTNPDDPSNNTIANGISSAGTIVGESDGMPTTWFGLGPTAEELQLPDVDGFTSGNVEAVVGTTLYGGATLGGQAFSAATGYVGVTWTDEGGAVEVPGTNNITALVNVGRIESAGTINGSNGQNEADEDGGAIGYLPGGSTSTATGVNATLDVVGYSTLESTDTVTEAFIYTTQAGMKGLGFLAPGQNSQANAINDSAVVVGQSYVGDNAGDAFVWSSATGMKDLNTLIPAHSGWVLQDATAISPGGLIVGTGINPQGQDAGFLLTPNALAPGKIVIVPAVASIKFPASVIAGTAVHGSARVELTNETAARERGAVTVNLFASNDGAIDSSAVQVATAKRSINLAAGKSVAVSVPVTSIPAALAAGAYTLLAQTIGSGGTSDGTTGPSLTVVAPLVSLTASVAPVTANSLKSGSTITIANSGNVADLGPITYVAGFSTDPLGQDSIGGTTSGVLLTKASRIKPAKSVKVHVRGWASVASALPPGEYYLTVMISDGKGNTALAVSAETVSVS